MRAHNFIPDIAEARCRFIAENGDLPVYLHVRSDVLSSIKVHMSYLDVDPKGSSLTHFMGMEVVPGETMLPFVLQGRLSTNVEKEE